MENPLRTENLLEDTEGLLRPRFEGLAKQFIRDLVVRWPAVACGGLRGLAFLLTRALLMTSSHSKAFCLGITSVIASPMSWAALKDTRSARCSMGTMFHCRYHLATEPLCAVTKRVQQQGITVYGAEIGDGSVPVHEHGANDRWGLVMGNEDRGVSQEMRAACDELVMIPQASGDSFNVGHAAAMCLYELGKGTAATRKHDAKGACA